jgi:alkanesulfonate monooxygenase SsuD/methylene tetrahydromethanopterin reductase-like flavin-dependent oxidoreductase (luciferase family)
VDRNIYLRHPYVSAQAAALAAEATGGRFVLGLGVSHQPVNGALEIDMGDPASAVVEYATAVRGWLRGEGAATHLPQHPAAVPVPIYLAALTSTTVERASAVADGLMPLFWSPERVAKAMTWIGRGRSAATTTPAVDLTLGLPTFIGADRAMLYEAARQNLGLYTTFPFFQHLFKAMGYTDEAERMMNGAGGAALSERLLDAVCLIGEVDDCLERLAVYRDAGVGLPILMPPIGVDGARRHQALCPLNHADPSGSGSTPNMTKRSATTEDLSRSSLPRTIRPPFASRRLRPAPGAP